MIWSGEPLQRGPDWVGLAINVHVAYWPWAVCLWVLNLGPMLWAQGYMYNKLHLGSFTIVVEKITKILYPKGKPSSHLSFSKKMQHELGTNSSFSHRVQAITFTILTCLY